jgi:hypothetical protein
MMTMIMTVDSDNGRDRDNHRDRDNDRDRDVLTALTHCTQVYRSKLAHEVNSTLRLHIP